MSYFASLVNRSLVPSNRAQQSRPQQVRRREAALADAVERLEPRQLLAAISVSDATANKGAPLVFNVTLDAPAGAPISVKYAAANGTGKAGKDFAKSAGTVTFAAGETSKQVTVNTVANNVYGGNKTVVLKLSKPTKGNALADAVGTGTIVETGAPPVISVNNVTVQEGNKGSPTMTFTISMTGGSSSPVAVTYATEDLSPASATAGQDYTPTSKRLTFKGSKTTQQVKVKLRGDTTAEANEYFLLRLSNPANATLAAQPFGIGTIANDDGGSVATGTTVAASPATVNINPGGTAGVTVNLNRVSGDPVTVNYTTTNGTAVAGTDFTATTGTLTFAPGETSKTITVPIAETAGAGKSFTVDLSAPGAAELVAGSTSTTVTVSGNPAEPPTMSIANVSAAEGNAGTTNLTFTVTLSSPAPGPITATYATADGTATAGSDYTATTGTLAFAAGDTTKTITVPVLGDATAEQNETLTLTLSNLVNARAGTLVATGTITDDDTPTPTEPTVSVGDLSVAEGTGSNTAFTFTLTLSQALTTPVSVSYATADGTAVAGQDYTATTGTLTFAPGETSKTVTVTVTGDVTAEPNETFTLNLSNASAGIALARAAATATITNDDGTPGGTPTVSVSDVRVSEGPNTSAAFLVSLSTVSATPLTVDYATSNGTATSGADYTAGSGTLTFAPGETQKLITVPVTDDTAIEDDETITVTLTNPTGGTLNRATATGTIADNDGVEFGVGGSDETGFGGLGGTFNRFNYEITNSRSAPITNAQLWFYVAGSQNELNSLQPFQITDIGTIAVGGSDVKQVSVGGYPSLAGKRLFARLVANGAVYDFNQSIPI